MWISELRWTIGRGWTPSLSGVDPAADLVLCFADSSTFDDVAALADLRAAFPRARIVAGTAVATIRRNEIEREGAIAVVLHFVATPVRVVALPDIGTGNARAAGRTIATTLAHRDLSALLLLADGLGVNGSELLTGVRSVLGTACPVFGGMLTNDAGGRTTLLGVDAAPQPGVAAGIGFYGRRVRIGAGSGAGWDPFGPLRRISRSKGNILEELDGHPALDLYGRYVGEEFVGSSAAFLFPLLVWPPGQPDQAVVRTLIHFDPVTGAIMFAGNVPEGHIARLMRGNLDRVAMAAADAARQARLALPEPVEGDCLALMISCIGRLELLGQRACEEVEDAMAELDPKGVCGFGFYSFGEICRAAAASGAELHNQTMSITLLAEAAADA